MKAKIFRELQTIGLRSDIQEIVQFEFWNHNVKTHYAPEILG